jgi:hypothetical protein
MDLETQQVVAQLGHELRTIALFSPKLAYMLVLGQPLVYRSRHIELAWDTVDAENPILGAMFSDKMFQMFWVWDMSYALRRPDANDGVFGKLQQDWYAARAPYIDVNIRMTGREKFHITDGYVPIETIMGATPTNNRRNSAWILTADSNVAIDAINRRAFAEDEIPYQLRIVFSGLELSGCELPGCGYDEAVCYLRTHGILPKGPLQPREPLG